MIYDVYEPNVENPLGNKVINKKEIKLNKKKRPHSEISSKIQSRHIINLSGAHEFTPDFKWGSCYSIFSFMCMFC